MVVRSAAYWVIVTVIEAATPPSKLTTASQVMPAGSATVPVSVCAAEARAKSGAEHAASLQRTPSTSGTPLSEAIVKLSVAGAAKLIL